MARRPLAGAAVLFVLGIALGLCTGRWQAAACGWTITAIGWLVARRVPGGSSGEGITVLLLAFATGWLAAAGATSQRSAEVAWLDRLAGGRTRVTLVGTVSGDVDQQPLEHGGVRRRFALRRVLIKADGCARRAVAVPVHVTWYGPPDDAIHAVGGVHPVPVSGETWAFTGCIRLRHRELLPKVRATLRCGERDSARCSAASLRDWETLADHARQVTAARLARGIEGWGAVPGLVQAMFLGTRSAIPRELTQVFRDSGTIHIFAISGMNVALLAVVLAAMLSLAGVPRHWWCLALAPILVFYTVLTGLSASALRACLMAILYFGAPLLGRKPDALSTLGAAAVIALAINPFQLLDAGFALSFVVMGGLILLYTPLAELFRRWWRVDDAALDARAAVQGGELDASVVRRRRFRVKALRYFADLVAMSVSAWLASAPLTAWYFGRLTPISVLANLPIAPAAFFVGVASSVGLLVGLASPAFEAVLNNAAGGLTQLMIWCAQASVAVPGGACTLSKPALWQVGAWYVLLLLLAWWLWRCVRRPSGGADWMQERP